MMRRIALSRSALTSPQCRAAHCLHVLGSAVLDTYRVMFPSCFRPKLHMYCTITHSYRYT